MASTSAEGDKSKQRTASARSRGLRADGPRAEAESTTQGAVRERAGDAPIREATAATAPRSREPSPVPVDVVSSNSAPPATPERAATPPAPPQSTGGLRRSTRKKCPIHQSTLRAAADLTRGFAQKPQVAAAVTPVKTQGGVSHPAGGIFRVGLAS